MRAAAAGKTNSALIINMPTHCMLNATTKAKSTAKADSTRRVCIPRLRASVWFTDKINSRLNKIAQAVTTSAKTAVNEIKSSRVILSKSPIRKRENLLNCPPADINIKPSAIAVELKTPMTVSAPACDLFFMYVINSAKIIEKPNSPTISEPTPINAPIAIPVNAPCPNESEKNAMRLEQRRHQQDRDQCVAHEFVFKQDYHRADCNT